jgi:hypothetical protein
MSGFDFDSAQPDEAISTCQTCHLRIRFTRGLYWEDERGQISCPASAEGAGHRPDPSVILLCKVDGHSWPSERAGRELAEGEAETCSRCFLTRRLEQP